MPLIKKPATVIRKVIRKGPRALAQTGISPKPLSPHPDQFPYENEHPVEYQYQLKSFAGKTIDPIALACWMYEHGKKDTRIFCKGFTVDHQADLKDDILESLKPEYYKTAQEIRDYYSQKFLMLSLQSGTVKPHSTLRRSSPTWGPEWQPERQMTKFRTELIQYFVDSKDNYEYTENHLGMIYSLPRLYKEDQLLDKLREKYNIDSWRDKEPNSIVVRKTLYYIDVNRKKNWYRHGNGNRKDEFLNYWFHDENDRLYCIDLDMCHPFQRIWARLIEFSLEVEGKVHKNTNRDNLNYYTFGNWEILEEF
jgi:hypothetical protein